MFRSFPKDTGLPLRLIVLVVALFCFVAAAYAQADKEGGITKLTDTLELIGLSIVILTGVAGTVYGVFNRQKYASLLAIIAEKDLTIEAHQDSLEALTAKKAEQKVTYELKIQTQAATISRLDVNNESVTSVNLQMKAILKQLRLSGKWEGHEDEVFKAGVE